MTTSFHWPTIMSKLQDEDLVRRILGIGFLFILSLMVIILQKKYGKGIFIHSSVSSLSWSGSWPIPGRVFLGMRREYTLDQMLVHHSTSVHKRIHTRIHIQRQFIVTSLSIVMFLGTCLRLDRMRWGSSQIFVFSKCSHHSVPISGTGGCARLQSKGKEKRNQSMHTVNTSQNNIKSAQAF